MFLNSHLLHLEIVHFYVFNIKNIYFTDSLNNVFSRKLSTAAMGALYPIDGGPEGGCENPGCISGG